MADNCEICDKPGELVEMHHFHIHRACAPDYWREDHDKRDRFMAKVKSLAPTEYERWKRRERK